MGESIKRNNRWLRFLILQPTHSFPGQWDCKHYVSNGDEIGVHASGYAFDGSELLADSKMLAHHIAKHIGDACGEEMFGEFQEIVKRLNGNFALVVENSNAICAAVDRLRSIPLFYGISRGKLY